MDPQHLTKDEVVGFLNAVAADHRIGDFSFGWVKQPCVDENKLTLPNVLKQAIEYIEGKPDELQIEIVDDVQKKFAVGTHWQFMNATYRVTEHRPKGGVVFQSVSCPDTVLQYSGKQMKDINHYFKQIHLDDDSKDMVENLKKRFPVGSFWEGSFGFDRQCIVVQIYDHRPNTVSLRDVKKNDIFFRKWDYLHELKDTLKARPDMSTKVSLP